MSDARISAYADALLAIIRAEGNPAEIEDELFRFSQTLLNHDELRSTLADPHVPAAIREQVVADLLDGKSTAATSSIISLLVTNGRIAELSKIVEELTARRTVGGGEQVAEVRTAVALSDDQKARLAAALGARTNSQITVRNIVDPNVLGGVITTIGDSVLDGSIRSRLTQLRDAF